ncbi:succinate dehydrogenase [Sphingomonas panacis]|uniref:Succinate dehydrogenase cytochrome b556 subunit n=1 Tax=Sphingomonas panacis TaxID=1560345 RepID=A0A1B3Z685_9SPHN|nr:succinate dehydrogenase, cytochrome b556 subunit [Sphingomonas panacis]AOH82933.1 succinate dehydrogenase [Sphingomonas panacis]
MASQRPAARPLSPHLSIWRWGPHMTVSILHRVTGSGMATVGTLLLVWWLAAIAGGPQSYAVFHMVFAEFGKGVLGYIFGVGLTLSFFQHMASGIRHFILDTGAGYELNSAKRAAMATFIFSVLATIAFWAFLLGAK